MKNRLNQDVTDYKRHKISYVFEEESGRVDKTFLGIFRSNGNFSVKLY